MKWKSFAACFALLPIAACGTQENPPAGSTPVTSGFKVERQFTYPAEFAPGKAYSPGVLVGEKLYIAGQIDRDPKTGEQPDGIAAQTRMAMDNMGHVLRAAGMDHGNVLTCHVQLADMDNYKVLNAVYGSYFGPDHYPSRTTVEMPGLPRGANLEVTCLAFGDKSQIKIVMPSAGAIPGAMGPYRPAVWGGDMLYVSGNGARDPETNEVSPDMAKQTAQTLANISSILDAAGVSFDDTVYANTYFLGTEHYAAVDSVNQQRFDQGKGTARGTFCLSRLPGPTRVEITVVVARDTESIERIGGTPSGSVSGDTLWMPPVSGAGDDFEGQMRTSIEQVREALKAAGMDLSNVVNVYAYLKDIDAHMSQMNDIYKEYFPETPPARSAVQVIQDPLIQLRVVAVR